MQKIIQKAKVPHDVISNKTNKKFSNKSNRDPTIQVTMLMKGFEKRELTPKRWKQELISASVFDIDSKIYQNNTFL